MIDNNRLRIAVQKSGRLSDDSISLLKAIGIKLQIRDRLLIAHSTNQPIDLLLVRDDDIPGLVMDGVVDLGFIGQNELEEKRMNIVFCVFLGSSFKQLMDIVVGLCYLLHYSYFVVHVVY